ncbi:hypothetical protein LT493_02005 [Streptomyces tricolor]|nr:hypothetical protein [Streptomyces tricolor]
MGKVTMPTLAEVADNWLRLHGTNRVEGASGLDLPRPVRQPAQQGGSHRPPRPAQEDSPLRPHHLARGPGPGRQLLDSQAGVSARGRRAAFAPAGPDRRRSPARSPADTESRPTPLSRRAEGQVGRVVLPRRGG